MAYEHDGAAAKPDILCVGKAMSGGMMPVSAAFANDAVMMNIKPGDHGSTYGGNPLAMLVAKVAIETMIEEKMIENAVKMGDIFHDKLSKLKSRLIKDVRGRGLF
jgi:ornithine--oxo-acid transaminase